MGVSRVCLVCVYEAVSKRGNREGGGNERGELRKMGGRKREERIRWRGKRRRGKGGEKKRVMGEKKRRKGGGHGKEKKEIIL